MGGEACDVRAPFQAPGKRDACSEGRSAEAGPKPGGAATALSDYAQQRLSSPREWLTTFPSNGIDVLGLALEVQLTLDFAAAVFRGCSLFLVSLVLRWSSQ